MVESSGNSLIDDELASRFAMHIVDQAQAAAAAAFFETAARNAFHWADHCLKLLQQASPEPRPPACRAGCDACCYNQVELTAPEALNIGAYLADTLDGNDLQRLLGRVEKSFSRQTGKTKIQLAGRRAELPCPLLADGCCLVYEVRPLMCRAMHSLEEKACRQELADPRLSKVKFYLHRHIIHVSISQGLVDACRALGYQPGPVGLVSFLWQYFSQPDVPRRWLGWEAVFPDAGG